MRLPVFVNNTFVMKDFTHQLVNQVGAGSAELVFIAPTPLLKLFAMSINIPNRCHHHAMLALPILSHHPEVLRHIIVHAILHIFQPLQIPSKLLVNFVLLVNIVLMI